ncbi:MAG: HEAT repeat domain-containing protein [Synechococcales bacterium]|nr:HEAT repeat domain-containing protein [Synechococcales bacterium]
MSDRRALFSLVFVLGLGASGLQATAALPLPNSDPISQPVLYSQGFTSIAAAEPETNSGEMRLKFPDFWRSLILGGLGTLAIALLCYHLGRSHGVRQTEASLPSRATGNTASHRSTSRNANLPKAALEDAASQKVTNQGIAPSNTPPLTPTRLPKAEPGELLIKHLHHSDPSLRRQAIWQLGQQGTTDAVQPLIDLMVDADSQQRSLILAAISEIGVRTLMPLSRALMLSLQDESAEVRQNAVRDITRVYDLMAQVSQVLRYAAEDTNAEVRETACWALGQLNRIHSAPTPSIAPRSIESPPIDSRPTEPRPLEDSKPETAS